MRFSHFVGRLCAAAAPTGATSMLVTTMPAMAGIVVTSMLVAPVGAAAAHSLPTKWLKRIYAVLLYVLAVRMLIKVW